MKVSAKTNGRSNVSSYAGGTGEALPWGLVLVEGIVAALLGLVLLVAPGASLVFLVWLLGIYLLIAGIFRIVGIFLDASSWGWKLAAGLLCLIAGLAILSNPLWSTTVASTWLGILVGLFLVINPLMGVATLRASASRLATFRTWRRSVRLHRCSITDCYIRYSPTGGSSKWIEAFSEVLYLLATRFQT